MSEAFTFQRSAVGAHQHALQEIGKLAQSLGRSTFLDSLDDEQLADHWLDAWLLEPLEWDESRESLLDKDEVIHLGRPPTLGPYPPIRRLFLPLIKKDSNSLVLTIRPEKSWAQRGPNLASAAAYDEREAVIILRGTTNDLMNLRSTAQTLVGLINEDVIRYFGDFRSTILQIVKSRRAQLAQETNAFHREAQELGVRIRRRSDAAKLVDVRERKEVRVIRERPRGLSRANDPQLSSESIQRIIDLIDQSGRGFEVARKEFLRLGEEGLRHVIVGYLNAVFQSSDVTGETFSKDGKADLVIMVDGRAALVGECKFWGGPKLYGQTLGEQLGRYVLWRHTVAVLVTFSTNQNLTSVIAEAKRITEGHDSYRGGLRGQSDTYFISSHEHPDDSEKTIEVHHLFFNLYSSRDGTSAPG